MERPRARKVMTWAAAVATAASVTVMGVSPSSAATGTGATVVHLHASALNAVSGQHITFYTTVSPKVAGGAAPSGTVTFGGAVTPAVTAVLAKNATTGQQEAKTIAGFAPGSYTVSATYSGDATYVSYGPVNVTVTVSKANTTMTVTVTQSATRPGYWTIAAKAVSY